MSIFMTKRDRLEIFSEYASQLGLRLLPEEEISEGDMYLAIRNSPVPKLLTCKNNDKKNSWIVPSNIGTAYVYDTHECVKVVEEISA